MELINTTELLVDSWKRQAKMIAGLAQFVTEDLRACKPSEDGMSLDEQLCHVHQVRIGWLESTGSPRINDVGRVYRKVEGGYAPIDDLAEIRHQIDLSAAAVAGAFCDFMKPGAPDIKQYENPVLFVQHMVWHEGYHAALILLGLRLAGHEPSEEWQEKNLWEPWRGVEVRE